jgi:hypothetical protein
MTRKSNHVIPSAVRGGWAVKKSGSVRISKSFDRKDEAVRFGRELSKREETELFIHKRDGTIQERNTYSKDPHPPIG